MTKLNIGCGYKKEEGYINIDNNIKCGPDILRDLNKGLPFSDNSIDEIKTEHTLEHISDLKFLMEEIYRVLKPDGVLNYIVPYCLKGTGGFRHCEHIHFFTEDWHLFFTEWAEQNDYNCNFEFVNQELIEENDNTFVLKGQLKKKGLKNNMNFNPSIQKINNLLKNIDYNKDMFLVLVLHNEKRLLFSNLKKEEIENIYTKLGIK